MTICLIERTWERIQKHIPADQAAYQPGRGTTEQVFAINILAEKAIISQDYRIQLLLLDMSDTVNRKTLFEELQEVLEEDEMHLISIFTNRPKVQVKINELETKVPQQLHKYDLSVNPTKTERYEIPNPPPPPPPNPTMETLIKHKDEKMLWSELDWLVNYKPKTKDRTPDWKDCKLLGSKLGTDKDIARRKSLTIDSMKKMEYIYKSKNLTLEMKIRTFNAFSGSVCLYNPELWSMTATTEKKIDSFHRRMLRQAIHVRWPKKISNVNLYRKTKVEPWSKTIKRRRLNWLGHFMRMQTDTPARIALKEALQPTTKKRGKAQTTWLKTTKKDLAHTIEIDIYHCSAEETTSRLESLTLEEIHGNQQ